MTIDSDSEEDRSKKSKSKSNKGKEPAVADDDVTLNPDFTFDATGDVYADLLGDTSQLDDLLRTRKRKHVEVDEDED